MGSSVFSLTSNLPLLPVTSDYLNSTMLALALLSLVAAASAAQRPAFCHDLDCPIYTVVDTNNDYELRRYNVTKWAAITKEGADRDSVNSGMFRTLFNYIDGHNAANTKIPMTAPVLMRVVHGQGPNCGTNFTMHFMLPHAMWSSPITPSDNHVSLVTLPAMDVYVKSFPGWARDDDYMQAALALSQKLSAEGVAFQHDQWFTAGYDGPYQLLNRHNEVWIQKA